MSENWKFQASPKIGDIMYNIRGETAEEFEANLLEFPLAAATQLLANLQGGATLAPIVQPTSVSAPSVPPQGQPWGQGAPAQQAPPQQQGSGKQCSACGSVMVQATTRTGKPQLKCPQYRYANGANNGHDLDWL